MSSHLREFITRHRSSNDPDIADLLQQVDHGAVELSTYSPDGSSSELASTYETRATIAQKAGREDSAAQMRALASPCRANGNNACSIWFFAGAEMSYAVFELQPANFIAACIKLEGNAAEPPSEA